MDPTEMPTLFSDHPRSVQIVLAGVIPFCFGGVVGVVLGISAGAYWSLSAVAALGAVLAGLEHQTARGGALRGLLAGALYGLGILLAHAVAGTDAKVSLGSFPPLLIVIDAIFGAALAAFGGRSSRRSREPAAARRSPPV
jgi:hypothetical protein